MTENPPLFEINSQQTCQYLKINKIENYKIKIFNRKQENGLYKYQVGWIGRLKQKFWVDEIVIGNLNYYLDKKNLPCLTEEFVPPAKKGPTTRKATTKTGRKSSKRKDITKESPQPESKKVKHDLMTDETTTPSMDVSFNPITLETQTSANEMLTQSRAESIFSVATSSTPRSKNYSNPVICTKSKYNFKNKLIQDILLIYLHQKNRTKTHGTILEEIKMLANDFQAQMNRLKIEVNEQLNYGQILYKDTEEMVQLKNNRFLSLFEAGSGSSSGTTSETEEINTSHVEDNLSSGQDENERANNKNNKPKVDTPTPETTDLTPSEHQNTETGDFQTAVSSSLDATNENFPNVLKTKILLNENNTLYSVTELKILTKNELEELDLGKLNQIYQKEKRRLENLEWEGWIKFWRFLNLTLFFQRKFPKSRPKPPFLDRNSQLNTKFSEIRETIDENLYFQISKLTYLKEFRQAVEKLNEKQHKRMLGIIDEDDNQDNKNLDTPEKNLSGNVKLSANLASATGARPEKSQPASIFPPEFHNYQNPLFPSSRLGKNSILLTASNQKMVNGGNLKYGQKYSGKYKLPTNETTSGVSSDKNLGVNTLDSDEMAVGSNSGVDKTVESTILSPLRWEQFFGRESRILKKGV